MAYFNSWIFFFLYNLYSDKIFDSFKFLLCLLVLAVLRSLILFPILDVCICFNGLLFYFKSCFPFFFWDRVSLCCPGWSTVVQSPCNLHLLVSSDSPHSASQVAETTGVCHHAQLIFVCLLETGFHHVVQAGLKLLTSSDPPASVSQSAGITSVSHNTRPRHFK